MKVELIRELCRWEVLRAQRLKLEKEFLKYTGHIDIVELHIPYTKYHYALEMMRDTRKRRGKKLLIYAGDSMNLDMFSAFYKRSADRSKPSVEWELLIEVLRKSEEIYDRIIFMQTNHDNRIFKIVMNTFSSKEMSDEVINQMKTYKDVFNEHGLKKMVTVRGAIFQVGDIIISHFENNSIVPGVVPRDVIKYLVPRIEKEWNVVYQAHTHAQSKIVNDRKIAIETGALCPPLDYWRSGRMKGKGKMTSLGYAVCDMKNGIADPNNSNFIFCEYEGWL